MAGGRPAPLPGLVTVGTTPEGPVLINILHAGTLSVEGDAGLVRGFLAGAALELATAPWAAQATLGLVGGDERLTERASVESLVPPLGDAGGPAGAAPAPLYRRVFDWLDAAPSPAMVLVAPGTVGVEELLRIASAVEARSGRAGLVAAGPVPGAKWRLVITADGRGVLHPLALELGCAVDADAVEAAIAAMATPEAAEPDGPATAAELHGGTAPGAPGVAVLGPVVIRWPVVAGRRRPTRRKLDKVVACLATHPERPVPAERLRTAIWPLSEDERAGEVADSSFRGTISRTRLALGTAPDGRTYLPESRDGCYQLDAAFGCDWADFAALVRRARSAPAPEAMPLLDEALGLVRGAPFADSRPASVAAHTPRPFLVSQPALTMPTVFQR